MLVVQHDNGLHSTASVLFFSISFSSFRRYSHFLDLGYGFPPPPPPQQQQEVGIWDAVQDRHSCDLIVIQRE